jgi:phosphoinositide-3-kinase, regulatory subunit 4
VQGAFLEPEKKKARLVCRIFLPPSWRLKLHGVQSYDAALADLQSVIQEQLVTLLVDKSAVVKRAILNNTSSLCIFLGRQKANDVLLSHMLTYLNDRDWMLRYAFFQSIVDVAICVGGRSLDEYILPLMIQALSGIAICYKSLC